MENGKVERKAGTEEKKKRTDRKLPMPQQSLFPKVTPIGIDENVKIKGQTSVGQVMEINGKNAIVAFGSIKTTVKIDRLERSNAPSKDGRDCQEYICQQPDT